MTGIGNFIYVAARYTHITIVFFFFRLLLSTSIVFSLAYENFATISTILTNAAAEVEVAKKKYYIV